MIRSILLFLFCISCQNMFAQTYEGKVVDSLGNPVENAVVRNLSSGSRRERYQGIKTDRFGEYEIRVNDQDVIEINNHVDSTITYLKMNIDPFDQFVEPVEIEYIKPEEPDAVFDSPLTENYPLRPAEYGQKTDVKIEKDTAEFVVMSARENGGYSIIFDYRGSISEVDNTPDLQSEFTQGRPINGPPQFQDPSTLDPFSYGPTFSAAGLPAFEQDVFQTGFSNDLGLNVLYGKKNDFFGLSMQHHLDQGIIAPNQSQQWQVKLDYERDSVFYDGKLKAQLGVNLAETDMPYAGYNYGQILFGAWSQPASFDAENNFFDGNQITASNAYNNPFFLQEFNRDQQGRNRVFGFLNYSNNDVFGTIFQSKVSLSSSQSDWDFGQNPQAVSVLPVFFNRDVNRFDLNHFASFKFEEDYDMEVEVVLSQQYQQTDIQKNQFTNYTDVNNYPAGGTSAEIFDEELSRYTFNASVIWDFELNDYGELPIRNRFRQGVSTTNTNQQNVFYQFKNETELELEFIYGLDVSVFGSYEQTFTEPHLLSDNLGINALNQSIGSFNAYTERAEVLLLNEPEFLEQKNTVEVGAKVGDYLNRLDYDFLINYYRFNVQNAMSPVFDGNNFVYTNTADYHQRGLEMSLNVGYDFNSDLTARISSTFHHYRNETDRILLEGQDQVPFFGFQEVNKNFVEKQPVGALVGSAYLRDQNGNQVIGADGFPLVDPDLQVIGDINPDFVLDLVPEIRYKNFYLPVSMQWVNGVDVWNGTDATLDYYGRSQQSADLRDVTGFVFDGVDMNGNVNTTPVDFAPNTSVFDNRWTRYGFGGVVEEYVERDVNYFLIRNIGLGYSSDKRSKNQGLIKEYSVNLFAQNLFLTSDYTGSFAGNQLFNSPSGDGIDFFNLPLATTYGINFQLEY